MVKYATCDACGDPLRKDAHQPLCLECATARRSHARILEGLRKERRVHQTVTIVNRIKATMKFSLFQ